MLMPENFEIRDNGVLVIFVNEVEFEFVEKDDFIYSDKKKIILKHHAVINLANNAKIKVGPPVLLSSHDSGSFVFCREAVMNDGTKYCAVGEANGVKDNLWSEYLQQYPAETADNRAYERAVLGIVGLYGSIRHISEFIEDIQTVRITVDNIAKYIQVVIGFEMDLIHNRTKSIKITVDI